MKLKKVLSLALVSLMGVATFAACGEQAASVSTETSSVATESSSVAQETTDVEWTADVADIVERGVLRVGVKNDVLGFGFQDLLSGEYSGMEIDLAMKMAEQLGVEVEFTAVTAATRTELLDSGDLDCVIATFTITEERKESWAFTTPYYVDAVTALVEDASGVTNLEGLVGQTIGVSSGSTSARAMVAEMVEQGLIEQAEFDYDTFDASTWSTGVSFQQYDNYPAISTALAAGEIAAFCVDKSILSYYNTDGRSYIEDQFSPQDYGVATTLDSEMAAFSEELISAWLADGTIEALIAEHNL